MSFVTVDVDNVVFVDIVMVFSVYSGVPEGMDPLSAEDVDTDAFVGVGGDVNVVSDVGNNYVRAQILVNAEQKKRKLFQSFCS